ncbi:MotE family protein [Mesorhizobium microcysteis]|jgi:flagellar motility protein MotE (MotC chaperone)|uniref:MotE family protein n=1 Tax=Neoaquamicrobium microcysteis TaxID=2682781 RepID=A0A5D4GP47_9HYPH|nr:MotE family protein [Mesorhizobium microcysteis]TYR30107.1 MotE family protein [Mesorhizobium microcysteis]
MSRHSILRTRSASALAAGAGIVFGALVFGGTPAATQAVNAITEAAGELDDDIRRFCSNIADAARDRRYALQRAELETLQKDIDQRIVALEEKREEYEEWLARRNDFLAKAEENLVEIYSVMRPDAAAERLAAVNVEVAAGILMKLNVRKAGVILNEMNKDAAATLTGIMASATRKQDPT